VDRETQDFQPLLTQVNQPEPGAESGTGAHAAHDHLPNGLSILVRAGASLRRALLVSLALLLVSLAELAVLISYPGAEVDVVWGEASGKTLVELP